MLTASVHSAPPPEDPPLPNDDKTRAICSAHASDRISVPPDAANIDPELAAHNTTPVLETAFKLGQHLAAVLLPEPASAQGDGNVQNVSQNVSLSEVFSALASLLSSLSPEQQVQVASTALSRQCQQEQPVDLTSACGHIPKQARHNNSSGGASWKSGSTWSTTSPATPLPPHPPQPSNISGGGGGGSSVRSVPVSAGGCSSIGSGTLRSPYASSAGASVDWVNNTSAGGFDPVKGTSASRSSVGSAPFEGPQAAFSAPPPTPATITPVTSGNRTSNATAAAEASENPAPPVVLAEELCSRLEAAYKQISTLQEDLADAQSQQKSCDHSSGRKSGSECEKEEVTLAKDTSAAHHAFQQGYLQGHSHLLSQLSGLLTRLNMSQGKARLEQATRGGALLPPADLTSTTPPLLSAPNTSTTDDVATTASATHLASDTFMTTAATAPAPAPAPAVPLSAVPLAVAPVAVLPVVSSVVPSTTTPGEVLYSMFRVCDAVGNTFHVFSPTAASAAHHAFSSTANMSATSAAHAFPPTAGTAATTVAGRWNPSPDTAACGAARAFSPSMGASPAHAFLPTVGAPAASAAGRHTSSPIAVTANGVATAAAVAARNAFTPGTGASVDDKLSLNCSKPSRVSSTTSARPHRATTGGLGLPPKPPTSQPFATCKALAARLARSAGGAPAAPRDGSSTSPSASGTTSALQGCPNGTVSYPHGTSTQQYLEEVAALQSLPVGGSEAPLTAATVLQLLPTVAVKVLSGEWRTSPSSAAAGQSGSLSAGGHTAGHTSGHTGGTLCTASPTKIASAGGHTGGHTSITLCTASPTKTATSCAPSLTDLLIDAAVAEVTAADMSDLAASVQAISQTHARPDLDSAVTGQCYPAGLDCDTDCDTGNVNSGANDDHKPDDGDEGGDDSSDAEVALCLPPAFAATCGSAPPATTNNIPAVHHHHHQLGAQGCTRLAPVLSSSGVSRELGAQRSFRLAPGSTSTTFRPSTAFGATSPVAIPQGIIRLAPGSSTSASASGAITPIAPVTPVTLRVVSASHIPHTGASGVHGVTSGTGNISAMRSHSIAVVTHLTAHELRSHVIPTAATSFSSSTTNPSAVNLAVPTGLGATSGTTAAAGSEAWAEGEGEGLRAGSVLTTHGGLSQVWAANPEGLLGWGVLGTGSFLGTAAGSFFGSSNNSSNLPPVGAASAWSFLAPSQNPQQTEGQQHSSTPRTQPRSQLFNAVMFKRATSGKSSSVSASDNGSSTAGAKQVVKGSSRFSRFNSIGSGRFNSSGSGRSDSGHTRKSDDGSSLFGITLPSLPCFSVPPAATSPLPSFASAPFATSQTLSGQTLSGQTLSGLPVSTHARCSIASSNGSAASVNATTAAAAAPHFDDTPTGAVLSTPTPAAPLLSGCTAAGQSTSTPSPRAPSPPPPPQPQACALVPAAPSSTFSVVTSTTSSSTPRRPTPRPGALSVAQILGRDSTLLPPPVSATSSAIRRDGRGKASGSPSVAQMLRKVQGYKPSRGRAKAGYEYALFPCNSGRMNTTTTNSDSGSFGSSLIHTNKGSFVNPNNTSSKELSGTSFLGKLLRSKSSSSNSNGGSSKEDVHLPSSAMSAAQSCKAPPASNEHSSKDTFVATAIKATKPYNGESTTGSKDDTLASASIQANKPPAPVKVPAALYGAKSVSSVQGCRQDWGGSGFSIPAIMGSAALYTHRGIHQVSTQTTALTSAAAPSAAAAASAIATSLQAAASPAVSGRLTPPSPCFAPGWRGGGLLAFSRRSRHDGSGSYSRRGIAPPPVLETLTEQCEEGWPGDSKCENSRPGVTSEGGHAKTSDENSSSAANLEGCPGKDNSPDLIPLPGSGVTKHSGNTSEQGCLWSNSPGSSSSDVASGNSATNHSGSDVKPGSGNPAVVPAAVTTGASLMTAPESSTDTPHPSALASAEAPACSPTNTADTPAPAPASLTNKAPSFSVPAPASSSSSRAPAPLMKTATTAFDAAPKEPAVSQALAPAALTKKASSFLVPPSTTTSSSSTSKPLAPDTSTGAWVTVHITPQRTGSSLSSTSSGSSGVASRNMQAAKGAVSSKSRGGGGSGYAAATVASSARSTVKGRTGGCGSAAGLPSSADGAAVQPTPVVDRDSISSARVPASAGCASEPLASIHSRSLSKTSFSSKQQYSQRVEGLKKAPSNMSGQAGGGNGTRKGHRIKPSYNLLDLVSASVAGHGQGNSKSQGQGLPAQLSGINRGASRAPLPCSSPATEEAAAAGTAAAAAGAGAMGDGAEVGKGGSKASSTGASRWVSLLGGLTCMGRGGCAVRA